MSCSYLSLINDNIIVLKELEQFLKQLYLNKYSFTNHRFLNLIEFRIISCPPYSTLLFSVYSHFCVRVENKFKKLKNWKTAQNKIRAAFTTQLQEEKALESYYQHWIISCVITNDDDWYLFV